MDKCEVCSRRIKKLVPCRGCGRYFCHNCGNQSRGLCEDCLEYVEDAFDKDYEAEA